MTSSSPRRVVILGGGFAGINVAQRLERLVPRDGSVTITLIDAENYFTFTPLLPEVPSGSIQPQHIVCPHRALLRRTTVRQARVKRIDLERHCVIAAHCDRCGAETVPYDELILALGSVPNFFGTPGVAEHALTIKSLADASRLHAQLIGQLEHADLTDDPERQAELLTFVVVGGGFAGVETIAELNDFVRSAVRYYPRIDPRHIRVVLVHSGEWILPEVSQKLSEYALRVLQRRGVEVLLQTRVSRAEATRATLSDSRVLPLGTLVWAAGTSPHPLLNELALPRTPQGKLIVEPTGEIPGHAGLWAIGDSAAFPDVLTGGACPPTAQYAVRQGKRLAENLATVWRGGVRQPFRFRAQGLMAGLGRRCAVAEIFGFRFSGFLAWWLWRTIYLFKLPGWERKLRVATDWTFELLFPRDFVYLRPLHVGPRTEVISDHRADESCPRNEGDLPSECQLLTTQPLLSGTRS